MKKEIILGAIQEQKLARWYEVYSEVNKIQRISSIEFNQVLEELEEEGKITYSVQHDILKLK